MESSRKAHRAPLHGTSDKHAIGGVAGTEGMMPPREH